MRFRCSTPLCGSCRFTGNAFHKSRFALPQPVPGVGAYPSRVLCPQQPRTTVPHVGPSPSPRRLPRPSLRWRVLAPMFWHRSRNILWADQVASVGLLLPGRKAASFLSETAECPGGAASLSVSRTGVSATPVLARGGRRSSLAAERQEERKKR